ncbi:hypothetical protein BSPA14S_H0022 (plasmid) [Borreliella spielmanii A14S]|uniref:Uncharacterized protein n=1 Tax=Borreliella spielmanii A14S TaxID=498742 RepID=C0RCE8_9SPIR|nr:hypothetical protein BSPA14S_H0022 [Borreliella spielmanii A14S]
MLDKLKGYCFMTILLLSPNTFIKLKTNFLLLDTSFALKNFFI